MHRVTEPTRTVAVKTKEMPHSYRYRRVAQLPFLGLELVYVARPPKSNARQCDHRPTVTFPVAERHRLITGCQITLLGNSGTHTGVNNLPTEVAH